MFRTLKLISEGNIWVNWMRGFKIKNRTCIV